MEKRATSKKTFTRWPHTVLLHNVAHKHKYKVPVTYQGKIKLHGRNVGIHVTADGDVFTQSRNELDVCGGRNRYSGQGFAFWVRSHKQYFLSRRPADCKGSFIIYGEWCGRGINKGAIVCRIFPRFLAVFAVLMNNRLIICPTQIKALLLPGASTTTIDNISTSSRRDTDDLEKEANGEEEPVKIGEKESEVVVSVDESGSEDGGCASDAEDEYFDEEAEGEDQQAAAMNIKEEEPQEDDSAMPKDMYILPWMTKELELDFADSTQMANQLAYINRLVELVDVEDPWIKEMFGLSGVGEGVVWYPISLSKEGAIGRQEFDSHIFKTKGKSHQERRLPSPATLDPQELKSLSEFVDAFVTLPRLQHGLQDVSEGNFRMCDVERFVRWVMKDVERESRDEMMAAVGYTWSTVEKEVTKKAKAWYLTGVIEGTQIAEKKKKKAKEEMTEEEREAEERKKKRHKEKKERNRKNRENRLQQQQQDASKGNKDTATKKQNSKSRTTVNAFDLLAEEEA